MERTNKDKIMDGLQEAIHYVRQMTAEQSMAVIRERDAQIADLRASLQAMLDAYWGKGDGEPPPDFVQRALDLIDPSPLLQMGEDLR